MLSQSARTQARTSTCTPPLCLAFPCSCSSAVGGNYSLSPGVTFSCSRGDACNLLGWEMSEASSAGEKKKVGSGTFALFIPICLLAQRGARSTPEIILTSAF